MSAVRDYVSFRTSDDARCISIVLGEGDTATIVHRSPTEARRLVAQLQQVLETAAHSEQKADRTRRIMPAPARDRAA